MDFFSFEAALLRLKGALQLQNDKDVAAALGMEASAFNKRKARGSFPEEEVRALARAGLEDPELYMRRADMLSGGQRQRVAIARALVQEPKLILADEPIASLDVVMRAQIMDLVRDIAKRDGITVVMSLHQIDAARHYADRIIALSGGVITFDGPPGDLSQEAVEQIFRKKSPANAGGPAAEATRG
jgi:phosphonate transport system ATP-binding protein